MPLIRLFLLAMLLISTQQACTNRKQSDSATTSSDTTVAQNSPTTPENVQITSRLKNLALTPNSDWRDINLGDNFSAVAESEKGDSFENDAKHTGYTIDLPNLETADMLYYQTNGKVSAIDIDLFLNSSQSVNEYRSELETYFSARYWVSKSGNNGTHWTSPTGTTISMKDVSKGKDFGLKIKIGRAGTMMAS